MFVGEVVLQVIDHSGFISDLIEKMRHSSKLPLADFCGDRTWLGLSLERIEFVLEEKFLVGHKIAIDDLIQYT